MTMKKGEAYHHGNLRAAVLAEAEKALRADGLDKLSLRELSRALDVSHAAPRRHFRDRDELLDALAVLGFERLGAAMRQADPGAEDSFLARVTDQALAYLAFAEANSALLEVMFTRKRARGAADPVRAAALRNYEPGLAPFRAAVREGVIHSDDPERLATVFFGLVHGLAALAAADMIGRDAAETAIRDGIDHLAAGLRRD
ncbi:TetR/AcrR family transcriptional regulator [Nocardia brasiliensis]